MVEKRLGKASLFFVPSSTLLHCTVISRSGRLGIGPVTGKDKQYIPGGRCEGNVMPTKHTIYLCTAAEFHRWFCE
jgi:hypothetical protein